MTASSVFGIALGTNQGDRQENLEAGVTHLLARIPDARFLVGSALYETDPVDCAPGTQAFLNSVIEIEAAISPRELHGHLVAVEALMGRPLERERNAPRTLDLDLLYAGDYQSNDPVLTVPHPRLHQRRFVLQPLAEIRPHLILPGMILTVGEILAALADDPLSVRSAGTWKFHRLI